MSHKCFNGLSSCVGHGDSANAKFWAIETMETVFAHGVELSEKDCAILNKYASNKLPIFIRAKLTISDNLTVECTAMFAFMDIPGSPTYSANVQNATLDIVQPQEFGSGWAVGLTT